MRKKDVEDEHGHIISEFREAKKEDPGGEEDKIVKSTFDFSR